jgi:hypothetical protein
MGPTQSLDSVHMAKALQNHEFQISHLFAKRSHGHNGTRELCKPLERAAHCGTFNTTRLEGVE